jgi:hypothetical protein
LVQIFRFALWEDAQPFEVAWACGECSHHKVFSDLCFTHWSKLEYPLPCIVRAPCLIFALLLLLPLLLPLLLLLLWLQITPRPDK